MVAEALPSVIELRRADEKSRLTPIRKRPVEKVVGGQILWKPIDRQAALLLAKFPWYCHPPSSAQPEPTIKTKQRKRKTMKTPTIKETTNRDYVSETGLHVHVLPNGEHALRLDEIQAAICEQISKLPKETSPTVHQAEEAKKIIGELLYGIGGEMEKFRANVKVYLEDIRQTRFAVVSETSLMTKELKDVRQFFLGSDYHEQINRLREFVDLCERLQKLKQIGFLDSIADTMLRLSVP